MLHLFIIIIPTQQILEQLPQQLSSLTENDISRIPEHLEIGTVFKLLVKVGENDGILFVPAGSGVKMHEHPNEGDPSTWERYVFYDMKLNHMKTEMCNEGESHGISPADYDRLVGFTKERLHK